MGEDKDKWEMTKTNQQLFEPTVITSSLYYSPTTSQTETDKLFPDQKQKNEQQNIVNRDYVIQTKNRTPNIHDVYSDDLEITISSLNQKDTPLGQQELNTKGCSTQRTSYKRT